MAAAGSHVLGFHSAGADPISDFYRGKHITFLISGPAGSGYDAYARLLARNLQQHIPGNPTIVALNMPGAGGMLLLEYRLQLRTARRHAELHPPFQLAALSGHRRARRPVRRIATDRRLGRLVASNAVIGASSTSKSGVKTLEDLKTHEVVIGAFGGLSGHHEQHGRDEV